MIQRKGAKAQGRKEGNSLNESRFYRRTSYMTSLQITRAAFCRDDIHVVHRKHRNENPIRDLLNLFFASSRLRVFAFMIVVLFLAAVLRFHHLGAQSFWNDEGNSYVQSTRTISEIAVNAARDIHPPGYYWLLGTWRLLTGETEFALRALSAFASLLSVAFMFSLGRRLYGAWVGLIAALIVTLHTFNIYYAQEARMYSLNALWAVGALWALVGLVQSTPHPPAPSPHAERGSRPALMRASPLSIRWRGDLGVRFVVALALFNAAGLWTHYSYPFVMIAQGILMVAWLIATIRQDGIRAFASILGLYILANLISIALYLPWLPIMLERIGSWAQVSEPVPFGEALGEILNLLVFGVTFEYSSPGGLALANILLLFGLLPLHRQARAWWRLLVPVAWVVAAVGLFLAFDLFRPANLKFLLPAQIGLALWLARGLWMIWNYITQRNRETEKQRKTGNEGELNFAEKPSAPLSLRASVLRFYLLRLVAVLMGMWLVMNLAAGIRPLYADPDYQRADYREIARVIADDAQPNDAIILDAPNQVEVFRYYFNGETPIYTLPPGLGGDDDATRVAVEEIMNVHDRAFVVFWGETERDPNRIVETILDAQTFEVGDTWYGDVRLARYVMPAELAESIPVNAQFGDHITLESFALNDEEFEPGDVLQVRLDWRTDESLETRYKVFLQLLDENGLLAAQRDSEPGGGLALTTTWTPGETVTDRHGLLLPPDLSPAHYILIVGLYSINDAEARLPVDNDGAVNYLTLGNIVVMDKRE